MFMYLFLKLDIEPIAIDADIVFMEPNFISQFTDEADIEVQFDSRIYARIPVDKNPPLWDPNLGLFKLHPTEAVMKLMPIWLTRMFNAPKMHDQSALKKILSESFPGQWINNDTMKIGPITLRYLDPIYVANAGGLWQEEKDAWKAEAKRRNIVRPALIHFFHIGFVREKRGIIVEKELSFADKKYQCVAEVPKGLVDFVTWKD
jgi:hypothetical protein